MGTFDKIKKMLNLLAKVKNPRVELGASTITMYPEVAYEAFGPCVYTNIWRKQAVTEHTLREKSTVL